MSVKEIKALERRYYEGMNKGRAATMAIIDETCALNYVFHSSSGRDIRNIEDFKQFNSELFSAFPDIQFTIEDMIAEGDKAVVRYTMTGTHKGDMGVPPTKKKVTVWGISIDRVAGGKFVEGWSRFDTLGFMQQLGAVPTPKR
jgi:predicted ester cyclase